jgi:hypothetical protein
MLVYLSMTALGGATLGPLLVTGALLAGCAGEEGVPLARWKLVTEDGKSVDVTLPTHVGEIVPHDKPYHLRAKVDVPESLRGGPLSITIAHLPAVVSLTENGRFIEPLEPEPKGVYRTAGAHAWTLAPTNDESIEIDLEIDHQWMGSARLDSAPRLSKNGREERSFLLRKSITDFGTMLALGILPTLFVAYSVLFLRFKRRALEPTRSHFWFAVQTAMATFYGLFTLGYTARFLGRFDLLPFAISQGMFPVAGMYWAHHIFGAGPLPKGIRWLGILFAILAPLALFPYDYRPVALSLVPLNALTILYLARVCIRAMRRPEVSWNAYVTSLALSLFVLAVSFEGPWWLGIGDGFEGIRPAGWALVALSAGQTIVIGSDLMRALARGDELVHELAGRVDLLEEKNRAIEILNVELRHQISERSKELATALAELGGGTAAARDLAPGRVVDERWRVVRRIGGGGMGEVYAVERIIDGQAFALKVMAKRMDPIASARFAREAELLSRVRHDNVVSVVDVHVSSEGFLYIVMEYVEGTSLAEKRERFGDVPWALHVLQQIAAGLGAIHEAGIVHRDLKPANVLVSDTTLKIADFGVSRLDRFAASSPPPRDSSAESATEPVDPDVTVTSERSIEAPVTRRSSSRTATAKAELTRTGHAIGTPLYMAPELLAGTSTPRASADVYSLGLVAFELLTGTHPRKGSVVAFAELGEKKERAIPTEIARIVERALAIQPERRPTATEMYAAFSAAIVGAAANGIR